MPKIELIDDHYCFACGKDNPDGLDLDWAISGKTCHTIFTPKRKFQGWKGIVHGGIVASLLDEAMTRLAWITCGGAMTAEMSVRFLKPASIHEKIYVFGEVVSESRKLVLMRAALHKNSKNGEVLARSEEKAVKIKPIK